MKLWLFVLSGTVAALAGVILTARFASARADIGEGLTLTVITIVLLGGVNIFGGRGTIPGVVLAFLTLAVLGNVLRLANVSAEIQSIAVGVLLIVSVVIPNLARQVTAAVEAQGGRRPPPAAGAGGAAVHEQRRRPLVQAIAAARRNSRRRRARRRGMCERRGIAAPPPGAIRGGHVGGGPVRAGASAAPRRRRRPRSRSSRSRSTTRTSTPPRPAPRRRPPSSAAQFKQIGSSRRDRAEPVHPGRHDAGLQRDRDLGERAGRGRTGAQGRQGRRHQGRRL